MTTPAGLEDEERESPRRELFLSLACALLWVVLVDLSTNHTPPQWDALSYVDVAEHGWLGNDQLVAPFAYRPGVPLVARALSNAFSISVLNGFSIVTRIAALAELCAAFHLARLFGASRRSALVAMAVVALSYFHLKLPLFYDSLVDVAAYPFMLLALWALYSRRFVACLALSSLGLFFKEFLAVPAILLGFELGVEMVRRRNLARLPLLLAALILPALGFAVPRALLPIATSKQYVEIAGNPDLWVYLTYIPRRWTRDVNILFDLASYALPLLLIATPQRLRRAWNDLGALRPTLILSFVLVLGLTMYGGTNVSIFVTYAVGVLIALLVKILQQGVAPLEIGFMLLAMLIYNRILLPIPLPSESLDDSLGYIDHYAGWGSRLSAATAWRAGELCLYVLLSIGLRRIVSSRATRSA